MKRIAGSVVAGTILLALAGCNRNTGPDAANLAPVGESYPQTAVQPAPDAAPPATAETLVEAPQPPPPLPQYQQPPCPGENYIWTPGYWAYQNTGYYFVSGAWVLAPYVDALWTPPYWAFDDGHYRWHQGYWGRYVGFYGGIHYGYGYTGLGFSGGYWNGRDFVYNRAVTNLNTNVIRNYYRHSVANATPDNRISFNGPRGIHRQPAPAELAVRPATHIAPLPVQDAHRREAAANRAQFAAATHGRPAVAAQSRPLAAPYRTPAAPPAAWQHQAARGPEPRAAQPVQPPHAAPFRGAAPRTAGRAAPPVRSERGEASRVEQPVSKPSPFGPSRAAPTGRRFGEASREAPPARGAAPSPQHRVEAPHTRPAEGRGAVSHAAPPPQAHGPGRGPEPHGEDRKK